MSKKLHASRFQALPLLLTAFLALSALSATAQEQEESFVLNGLQYSCSPVKEEGCFRLAGEKNVPFDDAVARCGAAPGCYEHARRRGVDYDGANLKCGRIRGCYEFAEFKRIGVDDAFRTCGRVSGCYDFAREHRVDFDAATRNCGVK
jgi:hypothetical protein